jgi:hypothetical protein
MSYVYNKQAMQQQDDEKQPQQQQPHQPHFDHHGSSSSAAFAAKDGVVVAPYQTCDAQQLQQLNLLGGYAATRHNYWESSDYGYVDASANFMNSHHYNYASQYYQGYPSYSNGGMAHSGGNNNFAPNGKKQPQEQQPHSASFSLTQPHFDHHSSSSSWSNTPSPLSIDSAPDSPPPSPGAAASGAASGAAEQATSSHQQRHSEQLQQQQQQHQNLHTAMLYPWMQIQRVTRPPKSKSPNSHSEKDEGVERTTLLVAGGGGGDEAEVASLDDEGNHLANSHMYMLKRPRTSFRSDQIMELEKEFLYNM